MRTPLDLPEELIKQAIETAHIKTKTKVIITALEELIKKSKISGIKNYKGKIELDIDPDSVRGACVYFNRLLNLG